MTYKTDAELLAELRRVDLSLCKLGPWEEDFVLHMREYPDNWGLSDKQRGVAVRLLRELEKGEK